MKQNRRAKALMGAGSQEAGVGRLDEFGGRDWGQVEERTELESYGCRGGAGRLVGAGWKPAAACLEQALSQAGIAFDRGDWHRGRRLSGVLTFDGDGVDMATWRIELSEDGVESRFALPIHIPEPFRLEAARLAAECNWSQRWGRFLVDMAGNGAVVYATGMPLGTNLAWAEMAIEQLIDCPLAALSEYGNGFLGLLRQEAVCEEESPPEVAVERAEERQKGGVRPGGDGVAADYSLKGLNIQGPVSLEALVGAVRRFVRQEGGADAPRMNILLSGPSGCGKTEFAKYLAQTVGLPLRTLTPSDLLRPCSGETEGLIAQAFRLAEADRTLLFFDEVDSFLSNRAEVSQQWERVRVNELLQRMERFHGVFLAATNLPDCLDPAVARRFTFKVPFGYLTPSGKRHFWGRFFGGASSEETLLRLDSIPDLAPGDFRTVRQQLWYLDRPVSDADRLDALAREVAAKRTARPRIGF